MRHVALVLLLAACSDPAQPAPEPPVHYTETRPECAARNSLRNAYFGDLHVHTALSFDAYVHEVRVTPEQAYEFARGGEVGVPPMGPDGTGTQRVRLRRPLDFAAVTDHAEFIGPALDCQTEGSAAYDGAICAQFRAGEGAGIVRWGLQLTAADPERFPELCKTPGVDCNASTGGAWSRLIDAAEEAYDRTEACQFTSFIGYEWTGNTGGSNLHRNVIFRNGDVPSFPISYFEEGTAPGLWRALDAVCNDVDGDCEVLAIPHNSNLSNGRMFVPEAPPDTDEAELAALRSRMEPLVEIFQHKGSSECMDGLSGILGAPDELCEVENLRLLADDCGDRTGGGLGIRNSGCVSRHDFVRNVLLTGLTEQQRLGVNPYRLGFIGSTDTHNGTPGATAEDAWAGHHGREEATIADRFGPPDIALTGIVNNPGGLAGIWAVENSRDGLFESLQRRETFGTSGPRIAPRFFGGESLSDDLCGSPDLLATAYAKGVPMGATLPGAGTPTFLAQATMDPDGNALSALQIVKGWVDADGNRRYEVFDVATVEGAVDPATCGTSGGAPSLCATWTDPDYDAAQPGWYYLRVVEVPSCRWSAWDCLRAPADSRPAGCDDPSIPTTIREMAWSSPIWTTPAP